MRYLNSLLLTYLLTGAGGEYWSVRVKARVVNVKKGGCRGFEIRSFRLSWNALIAHCM